MVRHLINLVRYVLQSVRKNIKPLILLTSFVTFVWLIVDTAHRPEFVRHASKHTFLSRNRTDSLAERWDQRSVQQFLDLLEVNLNGTGFDKQSPTACPPENTLLFTAFAGSSMVENLWHYFSLIALRNSVGLAANGHRIETMLTGTARAELNQIFFRTPFEVIDQDTINCYDMATARVLNDNTNIELMESGNQLYLLNNQAKRLTEILQVPWENQANFFVIRNDVRNTANNLLLVLRQHVAEDGSGDIFLGIQFVGIHIRADDELPLEYYLRAISFQRKMHDAGQLLFVVICENPKGDICSMLNAEGEHIQIVGEQDDLGVDFALMRLCNHTIVSSETDIFSALLRGSMGNTIVYGVQNDRNRNAIELANYRERWYTIV